jgi:hypothetical protein
VAYKFLIEWLPFLISWYLQHKEVIKRTNILYVQGN